MICIRCKTKEARKKWCVDCAKIVRKEQSSLWTKANRPKRGGKQMYIPTQTFERVELLKERVETPYTKKGEKRTITCGDVIDWLLKILDYNDYYSKNAKEIQVYKNNMKILLDETAKKTQSDRIKIKKYVEGFKFSEGQRIELDYTKVPGLDKFFDDEDMNLGEARK